MASFKCPYCNETFPLLDSTYKPFAFSFAQIDCPRGFYKLAESDADAYIMHQYCCPSCSNKTQIASGIGKDVKGITISLSPNSNTVQFPDYIPEQIRKDYAEACQILNLSPKASATLSRRCLQGIIHDFWEIHEKNLNAEITSLKKQIDISLWTAIDKVRSIGNIGAHMEHDIDLIIDIDPGEAEKLIKLIELLFKECYMARHNRTQLLNEIISIGEAKENQRKSE